MQGASVLIIDDDPLLRGSLTKLLQFSGFKVVATTGAIQACSIISTERFDLIIIDVMLPDIDGIELIRWARARADLTHIPIMAISGYDRNYLVAAISAGADEALHKPDELDNVVMTAEKLIGRSSPSAAQHTGAYPHAG